MRTGQPHRTLLGHTAPVTCLQFNETHVVTGSLDKSLRVSIVFYMLEPPTNCTPARFGIFGVAEYSKLSSMNMPSPGYSLTAERLSQPRERTLLRYRKRCLVILRCPVHTPFRFTTVRRCSILHCSRMAIRDQQNESGIWTVTSSPAHGTRQSRSGRCKPRTFVFLFKYHHVSIQASTLLHWTTLKTTQRLCNRSLQLRKLYIIRQVLI